MKVYVKEEEKVNKVPKVLSLIFGLFFICVSIVILYFSYKSTGSIIKTVTDMLFDFCMAFMFSGVFIIYLILKRPDLCTAKLLYKNKEEYLGKMINYMIFEVCTKGNVIYGLHNNEIRCFTYEDNDFDVNEYYNIKVSNNNIESIEEKCTGEKNCLKDYIVLNTIYMFRVMAFSVVVSGIIGLAFDRENFITYVVFVALVIIIYSAIAITKYNNKKMTDNLFEKSTKDE